MGLFSALVLTVALLLPGSGAGPVVFHVRYFAEGGSHQTHVDVRLRAGVAGEAWLDASEHDGRRVRTLTVCDPLGDGVRVAARILVPDGRTLDYYAPVGRRCFERPLGYTFSRWQLLFGARTSGVVPPPPLV